MLVSLKIIERYVDNWEYTASNGQRFNTTMNLLSNILQTYDCQNKICETQVLLLDFRLLQVQRRLSVGRRVS